MRRCSAERPIKGANGQVVAELQERVAKVRDTMRIDRPGLPSAAIRTAMLTPLRDLFVVDADDVGENDI
jgi:uncharacterized protein YxjI